MARTLQGMVVVITGASAGIGKSLAVALAGRGCRLVLAARRMDRLEALNAELGGTHLPLRIDVGVDQDCRVLIDRTLERFGRLDTLVCNAGYGLYQPVHQTDAHAMRRLFEVDVIGTTECIRHAVPAMMRQDVQDGWRGQVVIVSSAAARRGTPFLGAYSGAKAAQLAIAEALRVELAPRKIAVSSVHPIMTSTEFRASGEAISPYRLPQSPGWLSQSAGQVSAAMVRSIRRPRPEVWPHWPSRLVLGLGTLVPSWMDCGMGRYRDAVERENADPGAPDARQ